MSAGDIRDHRDNGDEKALDRLVAFGDAVVAIAITLVVLPIVDRAMDVPSAADFLSESLDSLISAALSFVVIAVLWRAHHRMMAYATGYTAAVLRLDLLWLAAVVVLPVATVLDIVGTGNDRLALAIYVGTILVAGVVVRLQETLLERAGLLDTGPVDPVARWLGAILLAVILILVIAVPQPGALWLLLLPLESVILRILGRRR
ncbi:TMEM175 family protein [Millisia brevis]|uniref:TMEM175 family protein n=1 Tax=Millisia brevis TaxID=264148 RepID=UPI0008373B6F|nr:TMEM175 family protein [Millisia brevis]